MGCKLMERGNIFSIFFPQVGNGPLKCWFSKSARMCSHECLYLYISIPICEEHALPLPLLLSLVFVCLLWATLGTVWLSQKIQCNIDNLVNKCADICICKLNFRM